MPSLAVLLGLLGLIPFLLCGIGAVGTNDPTASAMAAALLGYGAVVLAFLGAVHWGMAMAPGTRFQTQRLAWGVVPALIGWAALVLDRLAPNAVALAVLIFGFLGAMGMETQAARAGLLPRGYLAWRWAVTAGAVTILTLVLILRVFGIRPFDI